MRVSSRWWDLPCFALILCQIWGGQVAAQNSFLPPWTPGPNKNYSQNTAYNTGEIVILEWVVSLTNATLGLWQDNYPGNAQGGPSVTLINNLNGTTRNWEVTYGGINPSFHNVYYLQIDNAGDNGATSHYFNISGAPLSTSSSVTSTPISFISSTSTLSITVTTTSPPATVTVTIKGSSWSSGDTAGVVVGCVVGVALVLGTLWWFWRARKQRVQADGANSWAVTQQATKQVHELAGSRIEHELPGTGRRRSQVHETLALTTFSN